MRRINRISLLLCLLFAACATSTSPEDKQTSDTLNAQGKAFLAAGKTAEARDTYLSATAHDDQNARAWNGLGVAYNLLGKTDKAQDAFQHAVDLTPADLTFANNLAHVYLEKGDADAAIALLTPHAEDPAAPEALKQNLAAAKVMAQAKESVENNVYADLGSYVTEGMAEGHVKEAKDLLGDAGKDLIFLVLTEVKVAGGTPVFTIKVAGQSPQPICDLLYAKGIPCVPYGK